MNKKKFLLSPSKNALIVIIVGFFLTGCLEEPSSTDEQLPENQRYIDGNLTWSYLNQFLEPNPTSDLTGTWVGLNEQTDTYFLLHMSADYDATERYYYYTGIRSGTSTRSRIKTDDSFNILDVTYSSGNDITQHSAGDFEYRSWVGSSYYRLKKISNDLIELGTLNYSLYVYADDETHQVTDAITYYEEDWQEDTYSDYATFKLATAETENDRSVYFSLTASSYYCNLTTEIISVIVHQDNCFETDIDNTGVNVSFDSIDTDGNTATGKYSIVDLK